MKNLFSLLIFLFCSNVIFGQHDFLFHKFFPFDIDTTYYPGEFGYPIEWGPIVTDTIIGELVYAPEETVGVRFMYEEANDDFSDKFVLIQRGGCTVHEKVLNAQSRGAIAAIIVNFDNTFFDMAAGNLSNEVTIPSIFISSSMGENLIAKLLEEEQVIVAFTPDATLNTNVLFDNLELIIYSNPMVNESVIELLGIDFSKGEIEIFDTLGRKVRTENFPQNKFILKRKNLKSGNYFFRILLDDNFAAIGKIQVVD